MGAGHTVTALYELVPAGKKIDLPAVEPLRYQTALGPGTAHARQELLTVNVRYKAPIGGESKLLTLSINNTPRHWPEATPDFRFSAAVASFGMLLRDSEYKGRATYAVAAEMARAARSDDRNGHRGEFIELVELAGRLANERIAESRAVER